MSRCKACDTVLNNYELTRRFANSGEYVEMCNGCSKHIIDDIILMEGNMSLATLSDYEEETDYEQNVGLDDWSAAGLGNLAADDLLD